MEPHDLLSLNPETYTRNLVMVLGLLDQQRERKSESAKGIEKEKEQARETGTRSMHAREARVCQQNPTPHTLHPSLSRNLVLVLGLLDPGDEPLKRLQFGARLS